MRTPRSGSPLLLGLSLLALALCINPTEVCAQKSKPNREAKQGQQGRQGQQAWPNLLGGKGPLALLWSLDLTPEQRTQIQTILQQSFNPEALRAARRNQGTTAQGQAGANQDPLAALRRETFDKMMEVLTPAQRQALGEKLRANPPEAPNSFAPQQAPGEVFRMLLNPLPVAAGERDLYEQPGPAVALNGVDGPVLAAVRKAGLEPAALCSDEVFVRRVYVDMIGALPTPGEVFRFLEDTRPDKRAALIEQLFQRPEFADYWAMKWGDVLRIKAEFPINLWPLAAEVYHEWVWTSLRDNKPFDQMAREMLTSSGSNFRNPPVNFLRASQDRTPSGLAEVVALTFLGSRFKQWPSEKQDQMSLFFSRVGYKPTAEWKEEIVYWTREPLGTEEVLFPDGTQGKVRPDQDPREVFAAWLTAPENTAFARSVVNRVWYWLMGRGIVQEPDDLRADNPPSNPELLDYLARQFVASHYDLRALYRLILNSRTYQQSSLTTTKDPQAEALFAHYLTRPMEAEVLQDALCRIFQVGVGYTSEVPEPYTYVPKYQSTVSLADGSVTSPFLQTFGRPTRDKGLESDRGNSVTDSQRMYLINSTDLNTWINRSWNTRTLPAGIGRNPLLTVRYAWLTVLSRYPTPSEERTAQDALTSKPGGENQGLQDLVWALVNTKEFACRH